MYRPPLIGFFLGILTVAILWFAGPLLDGTGFSRNILEPLCTPMAYVISWITGISRSHESGLMLLMYSLLITPPLLGLIIGFIYSGVRTIINRNRA